MTTGLLRTCVSQNMEALFLETWPLCGTTTVPPRKGDDTKAKAATTASVHQVADAEETHEFLKMCTKGNKDVSWLASFVAKTGFSDRAGSDRRADLDLAHRFKDFVREWRCMRKLPCTARERATKPWYMYNRGVDNLHNWAASGRDVDGDPVRRGLALMLDRWEHWGTLFSFSVLYCSAFEGTYLSQERVKHMFLNFVFALVRGCV